MKFHFLKLAIPAVLFFAGCSEDDDVDNQAPTISNVSLNGMTENIIIAAGTEIEFDAHFEDNVQLGQYRLNIHDNFDGHSHGRVLASNFSYSKTQDLEGTSQTVHEHIPVPADATPGSYHFSILYFDADGNEGEPKFLQFEIVDAANQPLIEITSHDVLQEMEVEPGSSIILAGKIEDPDGLEEVHVQLAEEHDHDHEHGKIAEDPLFDQKLQLEGITSWELSNVGTIQIPEDASPGHYALNISATDTKGYKKTISIEVHIQ